MNFYTKVLARHVTSGDVQISVSFEVIPSDGVNPQRVEETRAALRELGLDDDVQSG
jgi:hypothetical protein